jgi:hypothetical protein
MAQKIWTNCPLQDCGHPVKVHATGMFVICSYAQCHLQRWFSADSRVLHGRQASKQVCLLSTPPNRLHGSRTFPPTALWYRSLARNESILTSRARAGVQIPAPSEKWTTRQSRLQARDRKRQAKNRLSSASASASAASEEKSDDPHNTRVRRHFAHYEQSPLFEAFAKRLAQTNYAPSAIPQTVSRASKYLWWATKGTSISSDQLFKILTNLKSIDDWYDRRAPTRSCSVSSINAGRVCMSSVVGPTC